MTARKKRKKEPPKAINVVLYGEGVTPKALDAAVDEWAETQTRLPSRGARSAYIRTLILKDLKRRKLI